MILASTISTAGWVVIAPPVAAAATLLASKLLGQRRGWSALVLAGMIGWTLGVVAAGVVTEWEWDTLAMVATTFVFGTLLTMAAALVLDLLAPAGSLAQGAEAGLLGVRNPFARARRAAATTRRYREILRLAAANGVIRRHPDPTALPVGVRHTLEQAGGIFVKLGQVASTRADLLPTAWCTELALLRSSAAPAPEADIRPVLDDELGPDWEARFATFDWTPLAAASIAQIYAATTVDGTSVVVKVQRPGLDEVMETDSAAVLALAGLIERRTELGLALHPTGVAAEFLDDVAEELDLRIEATNAAELGAALADRPGARVPAVLREASTRRVLTEERVDGISISDAEGLRARGLDPSILAHRLVEVFLFQMFEVGVFHADPHPGNILVQDDGEIVLIDLGAVGRMGPGQRSAMVELLAAAATGDAGALRQALEQIVAIDRGVDLHLLDFGIEELLGRYNRAGGSISADTFSDLVVVLGRFDIRVPPWLGTLSRTFLTLEGTLRSIDPDFSLIDEARTATAHRARGALDVPTVRGLLEREAMTQLPRLRRIPERLDDLLDQASSGRLQASLSFFGDAANERVTTRLVNRIVLALISASLGLGSVGLLAVTGGPMVGDVPLNEVLGYIGLAAASVLTLRVVAGVVREGSG